MLHVTCYMLHYLEDVAGARARVRRVREEATAALQKRRRDVNVLAREVIEARLDQTDSIMPAQASITSMPAVAAAAKRAKQR